MNIVGIDPGKKGAAVIKRVEDGVLVAKELSILMDCPSLFSNIHKQIGLDHVFIEKAQAFPKDGVRNAFSYAMNFGRILGWIETLMIPYTLVPPQTWTRVMHIGCTGDNPKDKSLQVVRRLYPEADLTFSARARKPHDGLVDAILIATYGERIMGLMKRRKVNV